MNSLEITSIQLSSSRLSSEGITDSSANLGGYEWEPGELEAFCMQNASDLEKMLKSNQSPFSQGILSIQDKSLDNDQPNEELVAKTKRVSAACCLIS